MQQTLIFMSIVFIIQVLLNSQYSLHLISNAVANYFSQFLLNPIKFLYILQLSIMSQKASQSASSSSKVKPQQDPFTRQIRQHQSSKLTQFLNLFYSFVVGLLSGVVSKKYVNWPKTLGTLVAVTSYLYNKHCLH